MWAGFGSGRPCAAYDESILPAQVEHELQFADGHIVLMHLGCFNVYEAERLATTRHGNDRNCA